MENTNRGSWTGKIGFILAAAGSAVGLGNIWKFPRLAYANGGGAFLIIYIIVVATFGIGAMLAEFTVGRNAQKNPVDAAATVGRHKAWGIPGYLGIISGFIILAYFFQVCGWVMKYVVAYATGAKAVYADPSGYFMKNVLGQGTSFPWQGAIIFPLIYTILCIVVVSKGVNDGIEKLSKYMMPLLFILVTGLAIFGITRPGSLEGLKFYLVPDWSSVSGKTVLAACGQAFFSLSVGEGALCVYASYLDKKENLLTSTMTIAGMDFLVAFLAGLCAIPIAVSNGISVTDGGNAGFAFVSLAEAFEAMPFGTVVGFVFFASLFFAAFTSAVSVIEAIVAFVCEKWNVGRTKATIGVCVAAFVCGIPYTLAQAWTSIKGIWISSEGIIYPNLCDMIESIPDQLLLPLGATMFCILVAWRWGKGKFEQEVTSDGLYPSKLVNVYKYIIKFVVPIGIVFVFLQGFGFI